MWRGGFRLGQSVTGPFGCRCLTSFAMLRFHIPLIKPALWGALREKPPRCTQPEPSDELESVEERPVGGPLTNAGGD